MKARHFRYLFENVPDGIIQSGYLNDTRTEEKFFYIYMTENHGCRADESVYHAICDVARRLPKESIDLFVLGEYSLPYIAGMLGILSVCQMDTVVLPYVTRRQRLELAGTFSSYSNIPRETVRFLYNPYKTLKQHGVKQVYFLYGNSTGLTKDAKIPSKKWEFENVPRNEIRALTRDEEDVFPIVRAGYFIRCDWLFYFGAFGKHKNKTITMFAGPLKDGPKYVDSLFTAKNFTQTLRCSANPLQGDVLCDLRCMRYQDYDMMKQYVDGHKEFNSARAGFGVLLLGNVNLRENLDKILERYQAVMNRVRVITIPNGAKEGAWDAKILSCISGQRYHYWIAAMNENSSGEVIKDILLDSSYHKIMNVNAEYGCCFSGYLADKEESR